MLRTMAVLLMLITIGAGAAFAGNGWESDYDVLWDINVYDKCKGEEKTYRNSYIVNNELLWVVFIPDQMRVGEPNGRIIRIPRIDPCKSISMESVY
jgi:hypothetical protein